MANTTSYTSVVGWLAFIVVAGALVWAAVSDIRHYKIPNRIPIIIATAFVVAALWASLSATVGGVTTAAAAFAIGAALFAVGRLGGGDVKLFASLALWAGPTLLGPFTLATCLASLILSALLLSPLRRMMPAAPASAVAMTGSEAGARRPMPLGVAIAAGGLYLMARRVAGDH